MIACLVGCTTARPRVADPVRVTHGYVLCARPAHPTYAAFETAEPAWSARNTETLLRNATRMRTYVDALESTIECYEAQVQSIASEE